MLSWPSLSSGSSLSWTERAIFAENGQTSDAASSRNRTVGSRTVKVLSVSLSHAHADTHRARECAPRRRDQVDARQTAAPPCSTRSLRLSRSDEDAIPLDDLTCSPQRRFRHSELVSPSAYTVKLPEWPRDRTTASRRVRRSAESERKASRMLRPRLLIRLLRNSRRVPRRSSRGWTH